MTTDRWRRAEALYHAALERPAVERPAFIADACAGDAELQREVQSLVDQASLPGFLSDPAMAVAADLVDSSARGHWIGRRVGVYTIEAMLGKGGMGEVYRARDTRLGRDVAIKVLPPAFTANQDRLARFEREARLLAALNHPHIGTIHGVEEDAGVLALVLEYVDGDTLADRVRFGPLPVREALGIARQIADAVGAAHDKGIVHRDLKPANVKITPQGIVKVLDFGLAKSEAAAGTGELALSPTITSTGTDTGVILGTAAYMSPEQARGQSVDKRADVWAFGCVLYELLTGRSAFAESTSSDTIAAILRRDPDWAALPPDLPPGVVTLLHRCLEKDVHKRKRELGDARAELDDAISARLAGRVTHVPAAGPRRSRAAVPWMILSAALAAAFAIFAVWPRWRNPLEGAEFIRLTSFPGAEESPVISPDGRWVAFLSDQTGRHHVYTTPVSPISYENRTPNDGDLRASRPGSPDLGFTGDGLRIWLAGAPRAGRQLQVMTINGGAPTRFLEADVGDVSWSRSGRLIAFCRTGNGDPVWIADLSGSNGFKLFESAAGLHNHGATWSTDDQWIFFLHGHEDVGLNLYRIRPQVGSTPEALTHGASITAIAPMDARTVLYTGRDTDGAGPWLWALDVPTRRSRRISGGLERYKFVSSSVDGRTLAASLANPRASLWSVPIFPDRAAGPDDVRPAGQPGIHALMPRIRDNDTYYLSSYGSADGLWRLQNGRPQEIWPGARGALLEPAAPSRDGLYAAIVLRQNGRRTLAVVDTDGSGTQRLVGQSVDVRGSPDWTLDGKSLVVAGERVGEDNKREAGLFKIAADGSRLPEKMLEGDLTNPVVSPRDGMIFYGRLERGGNSILQGLLDGTPVDFGVSISMFTVFPHNYRVLPDGSGVVYIRGPRSTPEFMLFDINTRRITQLTRINSKTSFGELRGFDIAADGKSIIFDRVQENSDIVVIKRPR